MDTVPANVQPFPGQGADVWIEAYKEEVLAAKDEATIEAYIRILEKFAAWLTIRPGNSGQFHPQAMTRTAIECFSIPSPVSVIKAGARRPLWLLSLVARRPAASGTQSSPWRFDPRASIACSSRALRRPALCDP